MDFLPDSEVINLKYQLAQQIKASINRAAANKSSNTPFLESCVDTLVDEIADLKIELSKLSLNLADVKNNDNLETVSSANEDTKPLDSTVDNSAKNNGSIYTFPIHLDPEYLQNIDNFYYPEIGENQGSYIWIGPENKTSIQLQLNIAFPIKLIIKDVRFITEEIKESLQIFINGNRLELEIFKQNDGYTITSIWLPLYNNDSSQCTIDICVDKSISVREIYPDASDTRKLCMALKEIEIHNNSLEYVNT